MRALERSLAWVVGGDGIIGAALIRSLRFAGAQVRSTTRHREHVNEQVQFLDLADPHAVDFGHNVDVAYLCAALTDMKHCEADPVGTRRINVDAVCSIAERMSRSGAHIVYLSSNAVFSGQSDHPTEFSTVDPLTEYGKQKAEAEQRLAGHCPHLTLARMTKVVSETMPLLRQWRDTLNHGQTIHPFSDLLLSPVSLQYVTHALVQFGVDKRRGTYHLSGQHDVSYAEFALRYALQLGAEAQRIAACTSDATALTFRPKHASLDMRFTSEQTLIQPQSLNAVMAELTQQQFASTAQTVL